MAGLIPRQFIDDLLARTDIVEVVDSKVPLKKAGKNYQACCPFHTEKSPSFTVSQDKQFYHCFGCGAHGNAISFIMEYERLEFIDAIEELAGLHNLEVPREKNFSPAEQKKHLQAAKQKQDDYQLLEQISRFYQQQLKVHPDKELVIDYLKGRGLTGEIVKRFGIGYSADSWDGMMKVFANNAQTNQQLVDLGMAISGDKKRPYDRFRGRVMFPIRDKRGRVIGFGGRVMGDGTPKYLNSPETRIYHKGQELYGLYEAKQANKSLSRLVVVEGYMDVVALAQHGIDYAVASLGTSTTAEQLQTLFRTVNEVVCCYDGDRAGRDAAWRAMENALPLIRDGVSLKFIFLPDGEDPDSLVREQGKVAFEQLLTQARPLSDFLFEHLLAQVDINTVEGKAALTNTFEPYLAKLPESNTKQGIITKLANFFGHSSEQQLQKLTRTSVNKSKITTEKSTTKVTPIRLAIALLLEHPHLANALPELSITTLENVSMPGIPLLVNLMKQCQQHEGINSGQLLELWRGQVEEQQLAKLLCWQHDVLEENAEQVFIDVLERILDSFVENRTEALLQKARLGQMSDSEKHELHTLLNHQSG
jgi:DNA primase